MTARARASPAGNLPHGRVALVVYLYLLAGGLVVVLATLQVPLDDRIALPFDVGPIDRRVAGVGVWIVIGLLTSARSSIAAGRVAVAASLAPVVAACALGGPTAAAWVGMLGTIELREVRGDIPWYGALANRAMIIVPAVAGALVMAYLRSADGIEGTPGRLAATLAGGLVLGSVNGLMADLVVRARQARRASESGEMPLRVLLAMPFAEAALGWVFAEAYVAVAWWSAIVLVAAESAASSAIGRGQAEWWALHDPLTGLPNRRALDRRAEALRRRPVEGTAVFVLDLIGFKPVNDRYGHEAGDEVLRVIGERLVDAVRPGDLVARLGGDEFVIVAGHLGGDDVGGLASRLMSTVADPVPVADRTVHVGASVGYAPVDAGADLFAAVRQADRRMLATRAPRPADDRR